LLSDLLGDVSAAPPAAPAGMPTAASAPPPAAMGGGMDSLMDLLGGSAPAPAPAAPAAPAGMDAMMGMMGGMGVGSPAPAPGGFPPFAAWNKNGLLAMFVCSKEPSNPSVTTIEATFTNSLPGPITGLNFQVAVPKWMKLQMNPANGNTVPPSNSGSVVQVFKVANSMHGQKAVVLRIKIDMVINGQPVSETGQVDNFPAGI